MNISNGGPHLLLFERDQQLASLLTSELQLAGYECHTARTAVEVFDAIARFPIRMVLVNLAQAAAARREFWVALDTQRRGRGVQVFTFHCVNIAGYGAHDPDERSQTTMADMEVDGMMGLMNLVDAVRSRVPGPGAATNTMPRLSKVSVNSPPSPRPLSGSPAMGSAAYRSGPSSDAPSYQSPAYTSLQSTVNLSQSVPQQQPLASISPSTDSGEAGSTGQSSYTDRIRAVLYPNQKTWSSSPTGLTPPPEVHTEQDLQRPAPGSGKTGSMSGTTALQRLASGQTNFDGARESGLAQLSRLLQDYRTPTIEDTSSMAPFHEPDVSSYAANTRQPASNASALAGAMPSQSSQPVNQAATGLQAPASTPASSVEARSSRLDESSIGAQPLRAAPIQDLLENRTTVGLAGSESYTRQNAPLASSAPAPVPPLSSIAPSSVNISAPTPSPSASVLSVSSSAATAVSSREHTVPSQVEVAENRRQPSVIEAPDTGKLTGESQSSGEYENEELAPEVTMHGTATAFSLEALNAAESDASLASPNSATLIDIMESFPPMPPPKAQPPQPTVLNGRATRSLGSVLLAGHLVPENRLEVAQQIQRMLSGVDMNYQLGEILLMFKLLTPDQLLAASLVSYGLITTQQISALGRIRQELHAIGLEYDLENLLILFRILTPEQIREAKSNRQS
jgi:hypothetical protein